MSTERSAHAAAVGKLTAASVVDKDTENSIKAHLTQRSAGYDKMAKVRALPARSNRARFARLWQLGRPDNLAKKLCGMCVFFACQIWLMEFKNYNEVRRLSTPLRVPLCESSPRLMTVAARCGCTGSDVRRADEPGPAADAAAAGQGRRHSHGHRLDRRDVP